MSSPFPSRWTVEHPDRLQLYSLATPNGQKVGVMLEELGVPYEAHKIDFAKDDQHDPEYMAKVNPNGKIPGLIDPNGPGGAPLALMESGAILHYLAHKFGKLIPDDEAGRWEVMEWVFFQIGSVGPMFGQFGHFYKFAKGKTDTYGEERYADEVKRLLGVLETRLDGRSWLVGDTFTIADVSIFPWINALDFYEGKERVDYGQHPKVQAWIERCMAREGVQRGVLVCA